MVKGRGVSTYCLKRLSRDLTKGKLFAQFYDRSGRVSFGQVK